MDKYLKLQCVKGLLMNLEEQLGMRFQKDNLPENVKTIIVDKYYDAINEQFNEPEKAKEDLPLEYTFNIIVNGKRHVVRTQENQTIDWEKIVLLSDLVKTGKEILTVTFTYNQDDIKNSGGLLEVSDSINVKEDMIFNVCNTSKGES